MSDITWLDFQALGFLGFLTCAVGTLAAFLSSLGLTLHWKPIFAGGVRELPLYHVFVTGTLLHRESLSVVFLLHAAPFLGTISPVFCVGLVFGKAYRSGL